MGILSVISSILYIASKQGEIFERTVNLSGGGAFLFLFCSIVFTVSCAIYKPPVGLARALAGFQKNKGVYMDKKYKVSIIGVTDNSDINETAKKFASLFKIDEKKALNMLSRKSLIKQGIDESTANKYKKALDNIGVICSIENIEPKEKTTALESTSKIKDKNINTDGIQKPKNQYVAAVLSFFLGSFGIHKFYLGKIPLGILYLIFFWTYIPMLIGMAEALYFVLMKKEDFDKKYTSLPAPDVSKMFLSASDKLKEVQQKVQEKITEEQSKIKNQPNDKTQSSVSTCPYCAEEIKQNATVCPHCKKAILSKNPLANAVLSLIMFIVVFLILYYAISSFVNYEADKEYNDIMDKVERDMKRFTP